MIDLSPKTKKLLRTGLKVSGLLIVTGIVTWFAVINPYLTRQEKKRFEAAAAELEKLSQEIQTKIGPTTETNSDKSCGYASAKFSRGRRSCSVDGKLNYLGININQANEYLITASSIKGGELYPGPGNSSQTKFENTDEAEQLFSQEFYFDNLLCRISYEFTDIAKFVAPQNDEQNGLTIHLTCFGEAIAEHYPVEE